MGHAQQLNTTSVGFQPQPDSERGTIGILYPALATIFLAVWTSIHLNLDEYPTDPQYQLFGQRCFRVVTDLGSVL